MIHKINVQNIFAGNLITSRGPGNAFDFALAVVEKLISKEKANEVSKGMLLKCN